MAIGGRSSHNAAAASYPRGSVSKEAEWEDEDQEELVDAPLDDFDEEAALEEEPRTPVDDALEKASDTYDEPLAEEPRTPDEPAEEGPREAAAAEDGVVDSAEFDPWAHLEEPDLDLNFSSMNDDELQKIEDELAGDDHEAFPDFDHDEEEENYEDVEEKVEHSKMDAQDAPAREDDLDLDLIPEDARDAVEGNLQLKRALSTEMTNGNAKRRRTETGAVVMPSVDNKVAASLLKKWRLERDSASSFVLRMADPTCLDHLDQSRWAPSAAGKRTQSEQIYERLTLLKERQGPPGGPLDAAAAFGHRWHLTAADDETLAKLDHKSLQYVFREFDSARKLPEVLKEAEMSFDDGDIAAPDKPGFYVLGRSQCLELIDPFGDALVLGDANLTFSLQLAQHRKSLHHSGRIVATTFEKVDTLRDRYKEIDETIKTLQELGCEVMHNVDCTRLAVDPRFQGMEDKFGAVYYNFPHAGIVPGFFDGHPFVRWRHANLMHLFFRALRGFVKPGGCVKVSSNSRATGVRYSDIISGASNSDFVHEETFPFLDWQLARYRRSYGDRRDVQKRPEDGDVYNAQRAQSDMVYAFTYRPSGNAPRPPSISLPPTKDELMKSNEGRAGRLPSGNVARKQKVDELYDLFLSYVQGIHVG